MEVTKLSLLLKVLEGENAETVNRQLRLRIRALPDLGDHIKCGNSLIGPDFFNGHQKCLFDEDQLLRVNPFDWHAEFPEIMRVGGFDAVVGNPPYVRMEVFKEIKDYLRTHYRCHDERTDLYVNFIEREHDLLRPNGRLGMIVSNKFIRANYGEPVRRHLESCATIERILDLAGLPVFRGATVRTVILIIHKGRSQGRRPAVIYSPPPPVEDLAEVEEGTRTLAEIADPLSYRLRAADVRPGGWRLLRQDASKLMDRLSRRGAPLGEFTNGRICRGIVSGLNEAFVIDNQTRRSILAKNPAAKAIIRPFLQGRQIRRYEIEAANEFLIYTHHGVDMKPYPAVLEHLRPFRKQLQNRATRQE